MVNKRIKQYGTVVFTALILLILFGSLFIGIMGTVTSLSFMISTWYLDQNVINEAKELEKYQKLIFETKIFESIINDLKEDSDSVSELYSVGFMAFIVSVTITFISTAVLTKYRRELEGSTGNYLRLKLSLTQLTILFSIMFAISLVFISSLSFLMILKNQTILLFVSNLATIEDKTPTLLLLKDFFISSRFDLFLNTLNASFFALIGFTLLISKTIQFMNNEKATLVSESCIFASFFLLLVWIVFFIFIIGIEPAPTLSNPVEGTNLFDTSDGWLKP